MNRGKMETMTKLGLIAILATAASAGFADSKPDRSGESILKEMFVNHAKLQGAHALIWVGRSTAPDLPFLFDRSIELWYGGGKNFRLEQFGNFGGGSRSIYDGKRFQADPLTTGPRTRILLKKSTALMHESDPTMGFGRAGSSPLLAFFDGEEGFKKIVSEESFIRVVEAPQPFKAIEASLAGVGVIRFTYLANDPLKLVRKIEYDGVPDWRDSVAKSEKGFITMGSTVNKHEIFYEKINRKLDGSLFDTTPPKGFAVTEEADPNRRPGREQDEGTVD